MKVGDKVTIIIRGFGLDSEEDGNVIEEITKDYIKLNGINLKFYKYKDTYKTKIEDSPFNMTMIIKK